MAKIKEFFSKFKVSKKILIPIIGLVLFAGVAAAAYFYFPRGGQMKVVKSDVAVKKAVDYVNKNMLSQGMTATFKDISEKNGLYEFKLTVQGKDYSAYVTKNAALFFAEGIPQAIVLDEPTKGNDSAASADIGKTDRPNVKVFVMSYCPYGLQAQKMYLPVYDLLKNKADMGIYFVNYAMHGKKEVDENLRQYCIQKEQVDKFAPYLSCFTAATTSSDGTADYAKCLNSTGVDQTKLKSCVAATDKEFKVTADFNDKASWLSGQFPKFEVNDDLNQKYGVGGSPTIVVNEKDASSSLSARSPEAFKKLICSAFKTQPEECKTTLSEEQPSTGFGASAAANGAASGGGCAN